MKNLDKFFNPNSVAIIGASHDTGKIGHVITKNFLHSGYDGKIYPINPNTEPILGLETHASVKDVKEKIDLAVITVPSRVVAKVLEQCGQKKVKSAVIITSNFKEVGGEGIKKEEELKRIIKKYKINVIGPNCLGIYDAYTGVDTLFLPAYRMGRPDKGGIGFITQSGAFGSVILDWGSQEGFGVSKFISYGNAADLDEADLVEYLGSDDDTKVISMYIEGVHRGRKLMKAAETISRKKPILCLKSGRSTAGTRAAHSHTGSLAGADEIYTAAFKQSGIMRVNTIEEMFDYSQALASQPPMKGNRIAIITDGGGFGVMASDFAEEYGLRLPQLSKETQNTMRKKLLPYASLTNPIDLTGSATGDMYGVALEACMKDKNIDGMLTILLYQPPNIESDVVQTVLAASERAKKPMLVCSAGGTYTQLHVDILEKSGIPTFPSPARAVKAMAALYEYHKIRKKPI